MNNTLHLLATAAANLLEEYQAVMDAECSGIKPSRPVDDGFVADFKAVLSEFDGLELDDKPLALQYLGDK